ncbi:MAG: hypothetical protein ABI557_13270, partial [Aureliella sp.]
MSTTVTRAVPSRNLESFGKPNSQVVDNQSVGDADQNVGAERESAEYWARALAHDSLMSTCTTIGLVTGSRSNSPRCVIDAYARLIASARRECRAKRPMLILRLDVCTTSVPQRSGQEAESPPAVTASPLGPWSEVTVPMPIGNR